METFTGATGLSWKPRMHPEADENNCIRQIAAGSEDALRRLVAAYGQRLYAYALRLTEDPGLADEVLQQTLIAVWQGAGRFRGEGRAVAWLLGIVHHKALSLVRKRPPVSLDDDRTPEIRAVDAPLDQNVESLDQRQALRQGLDQLSVDHRAALELVFYQGLSLNEAAAVLNCPVGTVKSRLNYAKTALRGWLVKEGFGAEEVG